MARDDKDLPILRPVLPIQPQHRAPLPWDEVHGVTAQPDLFTPLARKTDPETSRLAAQRQDRESLEHQWHLIVTALQEHGPMNYSRIDVVLGWDHPKAARRLHELVDQKRIRATGKRTLTHTGSPARAYEAM